MKEDPSLLHARVGDALGSARVVPVRSSPGGGPLDLLSLRVEIGRIRPRAGRTAVTPTALLGDVVFEGLETVADCLEAAE